MFSFLKRRRWLFGLFLVVSLAVGEFWLYAANRLGGYMHQKTFGGSSLADFCEFERHCRLSVPPASELRRFCRASADRRRRHHRQDRGSAWRSQYLRPQSHHSYPFQPAGLQKADGAPLARLRHDGLTLDVAWKTSGLDKASLDIVALDWRPDAPGAGIAFNLQKLTAQVAWLADPSGGSVHFDFAGDGLTAPVLQSLLQQERPRQIEFERRHPSGPEYGERPADRRRGLAAKTRRDQHRQVRMAGRRRQLDDRRRAGRG